MLKKVLLSSLNIHCCQRVLDHLKIGIFKLAYQFYIANLKHLSQNILPTNLILEDIFRLKLLLKKTINQ